MLLRFASYSAWDEIKDLALNGDIEKLRQFLTDYRPPDAHVVEFHVTVLLIRTLLGGVQGHEDVGDRGELLRLLIYYGADGASDIDAASGAAPMHFTSYPGEAAALLDDGLETGADIVVEDDVGSVPQRDVVDSVAQRGVARRRQGRPSWIPSCFRCER